MPNRHIQRLALAVALCVTGATLELLNHLPRAGHGVNAGVAAPIVVATVPAPTTAPRPSVPTLPTITVRPDRAGAVAEMVTSGPRNGVAWVAASHLPTDASSHASAVFDMPYYSFAKSLPRITKE